LRTSVINKVAVMAGLFLVMLVPIAMIYSLVYERTSRRDEAAGVISNEWGHPQVISGPVLSVPFSYVIDRANAARETVTDRAVFLPELLQVDAAVSPEIRKRSLFGVPVYRVALRFTGRFKAPDVGAVFSGTPEVLWKGARVSMAVSDPRGIAGPVQLTWNGAQQTVAPGVADPSLGGRGDQRGRPGDRFSRCRGDAVRADVRIERHEVAAVSSSRQRHDRHDALFVAAPGISGGAAALPPHNRLRGVHGRLACAVLRPGLPIRVARRDHES